MAPVFEAIGCQTLPFEAFEVILVDGENQGKPHPFILELLDSLNRKTGGQLKTRLINLDSVGRAGGRNHALARAAGPVTLLWADDFSPAPDTFRLHLEFHQKHPELSAVAVGPGVFPRDIPITPFMHWLEDSGSLFGVSFTTGESEVEKRQFFYGGNTSLKTELLRSVGPSDERLPYHAFDDDELGMRLRAKKMQVYYLPEAIGYHYHQVGFEERQNAMRQLGQSLKIYDEEHKEPQPWHAKTSRLPALYRAFSRGSWLMWKISGSRAAQSKYYRYSMYAAIAEGYRTSLLHRYPVGR